MPRNPANFVQPNWDWGVITETLASNLQAAHEVFAAFAVDAANLSPLGQTPASGEPYGRRILFQSAKSEVMLATWKAGAQSAPHDHGSSRGIVWLAQGHFIEDLYRFDGSLHRIASCDHGDARAVTRVDAAGIHSMRVPLGGISLHIYHPPIHAMQVYDPSARRTLTVSDACGAWVPSDPELIVSVQTWPKPRAPFM
jgi:cysteine dioxygenase